MSDFDFLSRTMSFFDFVRINRNLFDFGQLCSTFPAIAQLYSTLFDFIGNFFYREKAEASWTTTKLENSNVKNRNDFENSNVLFLKIKLCFCSSDSYKQIAK